MYNVKGFELKNTLADMTVKEFETISHILKDESKETIERYLDVLEELGMPEDLMDSLSDVELFDIIKAFSAENPFTKLIPAVEVDGYTYVAYPEGESFVIKARDLSLIEKAIKNEANFLSRILAIVFKREDLGKTEHYAGAHITHKAKLFGALNAGQMYPYLLHITDTLNKHIQQHVESTDTTTAA